MVRNNDALRAEMEKAYEGYKFLDAEVKYNGVNAAFYIYCRMVKKADKKKNTRSKGRPKRKDGGSS
jgi:hypothetical protein